MHGYMGASGVCAHDIKYRRGGLYYATMVYNLVDDYPLHFLCSRVFSLALDLSHQGLKMILQVENSCVGSW